MNMFRGARPAGMQATCQKYFGTGSAESQACQKYFSTEKFFSPASRRRAPAFPPCAHSGVTLIDTLVGITLMVVVFVGIIGAFELSVDIVTNNKARAGAIALAQERMEYIRSLSYDALGTSGGIPSGALAQSETITQNDVKYTRRTVIEYVDDPKDGTGASDANSITADFKAAKVEVSWLSRNGTRYVTIATRVTPPTGMESAIPGGTLSVAAVSAAGAALPGAQVTITNASTSPTINTTTFTNASGSVILIGAPAASNYQVVVGESGYSSAQTYAVSSQNTNPNPGNLSVTTNHTTSATFAIDVLGSLTINTFLATTSTSTIPLPNVSLSIVGNKSIGSGPGGIVYKYGPSAISSGSGSSVTLSNLEWDSYTISATSSTYDISSSCNPQPTNLSPGANVTTNITLTPHTTNSLLVDVRSSATSALIPNANITLSRTGFSATSTTNACGQSFFGSLTSSASYTVVVSAGGYSTSTTTPLQVSGTTRASIAL